MEWYPPPDPRELFFFFVLKPDTPLAPAGLASSIYIMEYLLLIIQPVCEACLDTVSESESFPQRNPVEFGTAYVVLEGMALPGQAMERPALWRWKLCVLPGRHVLAQAMEVSCWGCYGASVSRASHMHVV